MGLKAVKTNCNINNSFGPGTARIFSAVVIQEVCKGDKSLDDEEYSDQPLEVDNDQLRAIVEADPLKTTQEITEELNVDHSTVIWYLKQIGKVKKRGKWVPDESECHSVMSDSS